MMFKQSLAQFVYVKFFTFPNRLIIQLAYQIYFNCHNLEIIKDRGARSLKKLDAQQQNFNLDNV